MPFKFQRQNCLVLGSSFDQFYFLVNFFFFPFQSKALDIALRLPPLFLMDQVLLGLHGHLIQIDLCILDVYK